ncbi:MAG: phosphoribosylamine--glycine ligase [Synergistaceae bacterium]|jgi:phosphoribosylamine--glycine ligase|nr:phosphoribosylamine--glycine ligase [Synergistaceae bacterium]
MTGPGEKIDILILGGGGREHCIAHALSRSGITGKLHSAPGNPGIAELASLHDVDPCDGKAVADLCRANNIGLAVIGPEAPLAAGTADELRAAGVRVFGPGAKGARLESSKAFAKKFMARNGVPTSAFDICSSDGECAAAIASRKPPYVIKADGLAAGKGVFLTDDKNEALDICRDLLSGKALGGAGRTVVIEDFSPGRELTVFALTDGKSFRLLAPSRDHKRAFDGDKGPNTGGMGAYAPVSLTDGLMDRVVSEVLRPTLAGLAREGIDYRGVIYMGLMLGEGADGTTISTVEYNVRFGDPETQAALPLFSGDLGRVLLACAEGDAASCPDFSGSGAALCVVLASGGYPGEFKKGLPIQGLEKNIPGAFVYHAGTRVEGGRVLTAGGRVLTVTGTGRTFDEARRKAYERVGTISFDGMHYRKDIGWSEV